jgi:hypothetical protein
MESYVQVLIVLSHFRLLTRYISRRLAFNCARSDVLQQLYKFFWRAAIGPQLFQLLWGRWLLHSTRLVQHWN